VRKLLLGCTCSTSSDIMNLKLLGSNSIAKRLRPLLSIGAMVDWNLCRGTICRGCGLPCSSSGSSAKFLYRTPTGRRRLSSQFVPTHRRSISLPVCLSVICTASSVLHCTESCFTHDERYGVTADFIHEDSAALLRLCLATFRIRLGMEE
jgi:uncharacterized protein (DUF2132 family)